MNNLPLHQSLQTATIARPLPAGTQNAKQRHSRASRHGEKTLPHRRSQPPGGFETIRPSLLGNRIPMLEPVKSSSGIASTARTTWTWSSASRGCSTTKDLRSRARGGISASTMAPPNRRPKRQSCGGRGRAASERKMLLDLRDTLRAFLTLLERR